MFVIILLSGLFAKKDFYYNFIDSSGNQISEERKQQISDGFDIIQNARLMAKNGKIDEAYTQIKDFKEKNKDKVLTSDINILYAELSLKKVSKRFMIDAAKTLEDAINNSLINEYDLPTAYRLLVDLKLEINKVEDAKYFANIIINNFDDELIKTEGKVSLAKIYKYQKDYTRAIKTLYEVLAHTNDKNIATIVADELFELYFLNEQLDKAKELMGQILKNNIDYYANDSFLANKKINKLINFGMPQFASEILIELLSRSKSQEAIEDFKFKLANTYMLMYDRTDKYLDKAEELYKDIINDYPQGEYAKKSKMFLDEILMRQGSLKPSVVANKYMDSEAMQQKALLQELMNDKIDKKYELILKAEKVYRKISRDTAKRFGYESMDAIFDEVNIEMMTQYLNDGKCVELSDIMKTSRKESLEKLILNENTKYKFFDCLIEVPYEKAYLQVKDTFNTSRDATLYFYLEKMAFVLGLYDEALDYSYKVEMVNDKNILLQEFLYRYQILKNKNDELMLDKFFHYTSLNEDYIEKNQDNPALIDFYNDYYLYFVKNNKRDKSIEILNKLYNKQKELKAFIYSPFVEIEMASLSKEKNELDKSLDYLLEALKNSRKIKPNDEVKIYYDIYKLYDNKNNKSKRDEYLQKCRDVKNLKDNLYKKMCDDTK